MLYELLAYNTDSRYPNDIRYRGYTSSKKTAEMFKRIPKIQFSDSGHGVVFQAREFKGRKDRPIHNIADYVDEQMTKLRITSMKSSQVEAHKKRQGQLEALKATGIHCECRCNAFFISIDGENAAWRLADRFEGKNGTLIFIPD